MGSVEAMLAASIPDTHGAILQLLEMATALDGTPLDITEFKFRRGAV